MTTKNDGWIRISDRGKAKVAFGIGALNAAGACFIGGIAAAIAYAITGDVAQAGFAFLGSSLPLWIITLIAVSVGYYFRTRGVDRDSDTDVEVGR